MTSVPPAEDPRPVLRRDEVDALLERLRARLADDDFALVAAVVRSYVDVVGLLEHRRTTLERLRKLLFGAATEKTKGLFEDAFSALPPEEPEAEPPAAAPRAPRKGHGRRGAAAYAGADRRRVPLAELQAGNCCPDCGRGRLYGNVPPAVLVRVTGRAPLHATVWELERLRCNLCLEVRTAAAPPGVGEEKYDAKAAALLGTLKYGAGMPFHRLEALQDDCRIPLPASTQWEIVRDAAQELTPVFDELRRQAAAADVLHQDDTTMPVLDRPEEVDGRKGSYTTGLVARDADGRLRAVYVTGPQHAGENLRDLLQERPKDAEPPIQMCDALPANTPADLKTVVAHCLAHGRRGFVDAAPHFPAECKHVLERLAEVYVVDAEAARERLSPAARLARHQARSKPVMDALRDWMQARFDARQTEPNSSLGEAFTYLLKRWDRCTLFLRQAGAPLDNNLVERALKLAVLHRKNAYFYRTMRGAEVGDLFMSLIHTARLNHVSAFDYLTAVLEHPVAAHSAPGDWMPWNYPPGRAAPP